MPELTVSLAQSSYSIYVGAGLLADLDRHLAPFQPSRILIVTDREVASRYLAAALAAASRVAPTDQCVLTRGEAGKDLESVAAVIDVAAAARLDRRSLIVALGGGVVGDIAGFAASVYMRGIRFVQAPTTLLAQVDSSVGGKTGVNHAAGKNLIGAFHQPVAVIADTDTLTTLPDRELSAGLAEVLKHGLLADADYFTETVAALPRLLARDAEALTTAILRSCQIKAAIVGRDERESGERALLNLGHTFGHAIEALSGYGRWLHGEAVGCGLCLAADLSMRLELLSREDVQRITASVAAARLPVRIEGFDIGAAQRSMRGDKKAHAGRIGFIVLERIGCAIQREVPDALLEQTLHAGGYR
jgi:3-dehydroquinate synthase